MTENKLDCLFYEMKDEQNLITLINKRQIVSVVNSSITWTNITLTSGDLTNYQCDFPDLQEHLRLVKLDSFV